LDHTGLKREKLDRKDDDTLQRRMRGINGFDAPEAESKQRKFFEKAERVDESCFLFE